MEEEPKESIYNLIWFVQPESCERNDKFVYNPKVGPNNYKSVLGKNVSVIFLINHASFQKNPEMHWEIEIWVEQKTKQ